MPPMPLREEQEQEEEEGWELYHWSRQDNFDPLATTLSALEGRWHKAAVDDQS